LAGMILRGVDTAHPSLNANSLLTPAGKALYPQTVTRGRARLGSPSSPGGLPLNQLVSPTANLAPAIKQIAANDPDHLKVRGPFLLEQGLAYGTVFPQFDDALSHEMSNSGAKVPYHTWPGSSHGGVLISSA